ncbi:hypothetical protein FRC04_005770 [Tulasnella sp. 424]|nr:hypothetical protein FRC04_005770 [Tulasnella sp. 424]KAG8977554.1 hypothetical protein FRC05_001412 [Tulasnella sp. 425]
MRRAMRITHLLGNTSPASSPLKFTNPKLADGSNLFWEVSTSFTVTKPANILLSATCIPVLVIFGFAEHYSSSKTPKEKMFLSNLASGTPEYLSPERAKGPIHDTRLSVMWSLGVTFLEILVGRTPFELVEGEAFETQEDLERYWKRTKEGTWLGQEDWQRRMSDGLQSLLSANDVSRRKASHQGRRGIGRSVLGLRAIPLRRRQLLGLPSRNLHHPTPLSHPNVRIRAQGRRDHTRTRRRKRSRREAAAIIRLLLRKQPPRSPAAKKGKNRKDKPAEIVYQESSTPNTPARTATAASARRAAVRSSPPSHPSFSAAAKAPAALPQQQQPGSTAVARAVAASGIPSRGQVETLGDPLLSTAPNTSNKENAPSSARGKKKTMPEDDSAPVNVHTRKKVPARKPARVAL